MWFSRTQLAWHVLHKEKVRLFVAVLGISFANLLIFMQLGFCGALFYSCGTLYRSFYGDLCLVNPHYETLIQPLSFKRELMYRCQAYPEVARVQGVNVGLTGWRNPETGKMRSIQVAGYDPGYPALRAVGSQGDSLKILGNVLFDRLGRPEFGPIEAMFAKGPVFTEVNRKRVQVSGLFSLGASFAADGCMVTSDETFRMIFTDSRRDEIEFGFLFLKPGSQPEEIQPKLQAMIGTAARVLTRAQLEKLEENYWASSTGIGFIFNMGAAMGFMVGVVIVYQVLHSDIADHLPQYATLKAMGYSNGFLLLILGQESLILALLGYGPGLAFSLFLYQQASAATSLPIFMTADRAWGVLLGTIAMCLISAAIAARKLVSADPAEIF
ncbi:FtsX-like permease family protein [bacterium]|nr:FtsX-like permease family protein [bacterium]